MGLAISINIFFSILILNVLISVWLISFLNSSANIASELDSATYGLIFAWNTFIALTIQTAITFAVADEHGFALGIRDQVKWIFLFSENETGKLGIFSQIIWFGLLEIYLFQLKI